MSDRVEGSTSPYVPNLEGAVGSDAPEKTQAPSPAQAINRVEQAKVDERDFAKGNPFSSGKVRDYLDGVPTPGAAELELHGYFDHNGGTAKVEIERGSDGDFKVKVTGSAQVGLHLGVGAFAGGNGSATYSFRTPEAAADFLTSLATAPTPVVGWAAVKRVVHYQDDALRKVSVGTTDGMSASLPMPFLKGGLELKDDKSITYDANRGTLTIDQAVTGEAIGRFGGVIFGGGLEGEISAHVRTEIRATPDQIEAWRAGRLSLSDLAGRTELSSKLVIEGEGRGEFTTVFASKESQSRIVKAEAEVDLTKLGKVSLTEVLENPELAKKHIHGTLKTYQSTDGVVGGELQMAVLDAKVQAVRYRVTEEPLFHGHDAAKLQQELDGKRLTNSAPH